MPTWMIFTASVVFLLALEAMKRRKGGWWAEAHYLAHTAVIALLAVVLTTQIWTNGIDGMLIMAVVTFAMLRGLWEMWQDEHREREARHINARMIAEFERMRRHNPDFMKGFEVVDDSLIYRVRTDDGPDND